MKRELDEEIANYLEASVAHEMSIGMPAEMARRAALIVVSAITLLASWLPARGASNVDPMVALRAD